NTASQVQCFRINLAKLQKRKCEGDKAMVLRCSRCGSTDNVQLVYDSFSEEGKYRCSACVNQRFKHGAHIVKFTDTSHPLRPAYYLNLESEEDLDLVMTLGKRAQQFKAKGFQASFFKAHEKGRRIGLVSMSLGQMDSIIQLRGHVDKLRMWMETSTVLENEQLRSSPAKDDDDMPALFSPINPPKQAM
ncbi:MAG: hypothetical protein ACFFFC_20030, partial [Candidatus Thorarchaeota archaeon]